MLVKNPYVKFILKGQGIFSIHVNKILRLQVTLNSRYAKKVIRYSFFRIFAEGQESHVSQTNRVFLKRGLQPHSGSCFFFLSSALCASLTWLRREISIRKKYPLEPRVSITLFWPFPYASGLVPSSVFRSFLKILLCFVLVILTLYC